MMFSVNQELIAKARTVLASRHDIYWVIGAACAGKSTVCRQLSGKTGIAVYDMDEHIYGSYLGRYNLHRHPAATAWFLSSNPIAWVMSLSAQEFDALNRAVQAEFLDLFAADVEAKVKKPLLVDGGITHPAVLADVTAPERIVCLQTTTAERVARWESNPEREEIRSWVTALPDPRAMWQKFLSFDELIAQTIETECRTAGIPILLRDDSTSVDELVSAVARRFGIPMTLQE